MERSWLEPVQEAADGGRVFWNAIGDFAPYYFLNREIGVETVGRLTDVDLASRQGFPETAIEQIAMYDIRSVLTDSAGFQPLVNRLVAEDFVLSYTRATQMVLVSERPSVRVMQPPRKVALLGKAAELYWSRYIPNSVNIQALDTVPKEYLNSFSAIVISGLSLKDTTHQESILLRYMENGGSVILGEPNRSGDDWFGADSTDRPVPEVLFFGTGDDVVESKRFAIGSDRFVGTFYDDAGETVLHATDEQGEIVPVVQKREIGEGAIYWVCCNVGNHSIVNPGGDFGLVYTLRSFFEDEFDGYRDIWPEKFGDDMEYLGASDFRFSYQSDEPELVVLSTVWLRQRKVLLDDGIELKNYAYGKMTAVVVPAGEHHVLVTTESTVLKLSTFGFWLFSLAVAVIVLRFLWNKLSSPPSSGGFLPGLRRWVFEPPFVREFAISGGTLKVCEPRISNRFDLRTIDGNFWRIEPQHDESSLAVVLIDISASSVDPLEFDFSQLLLLDSTGIEFSAIPSTDLLTSESHFPNLFHLVDLKYSPLREPVSLRAGESVRGYVVFEFNSAAEYPFVHDGFVDLRR